ERLTGERAERDLRLVGAGGSVTGEDTTRADGVPGGGFAPTVTARTGPEASRTPPLPVPSAPPGTAQAATAAPGGRDRRARAVLVAGLAVLVLALAGLTYT
ncbi:serine/threonine protein kinase, partial [Streptomyces rochei]